jgi:hypothetical protein
MIALALTQAQSLVSTCFNRRVPPIGFDLDRLNEISLILVILGSLVRPRTTYGYDILSDSE